MPKLVVHGATIKCKYGSKTCKLSASTAEKFTVGSEHIGAIALDFTPGAHIQNFGTCSAPPKPDVPCMPITPLPWSLEWTNALVTSGPMLSTESKLMCLKFRDAEIAIQYAGQLDVVLVDISKLNDAAYRRRLLAEFARGQVNNPNQVDALANVLAYAAGLISDMPDRKPASPFALAFGGIDPAVVPWRARTMLDDAMHVLIGDGLRQSGIEGGRNSGRYLVRRFTDDGFKDEFLSVDQQGRRERHRAARNQVQHAMAGIIIGYRYRWLGEKLAQLQEYEPEDHRLYDATFPLGEELNDSNYKSLAGKVRNRLQK